MKRKWIIAGPVSIVLAAGAVLSAVGQEKQAPQPLTLPGVAAQVNGVDISMQEFWQSLLSNAGNAVLGTLVDQILVIQEVEKRLGAKPGSKKGAGGKIESEVDRRFQDLKKQFPDEKTFDQQLKNAGLSRENIKSQIRLGLYKERLLEDKIKVSSAEAKKYFEQNREQFNAPEQVHLKHIVVGSEQEAKDLLLALKVGANFDLLAKEKSLDMATKDRGGDLGFFAKGNLIPQMQDKAFSLEPGQVDTVKTPLGYHLIMVAERRAAREPRWDPETQKAVESLLRQAKFNEEYPKLVQALRSKADIQVYLNQ